MNKASNRGYKTPNKVYKKGKKRKSNNINDLKIRFDIGQLIIKFN